MPDYLPHADLWFLDGTHGAVEIGRGRRLVLFVFPRADTKGCTFEAKAFSDARDRLREAGVDCLGVSRDTLEALCRFRDRHQLSVTLASDQEGHLTDALGLWGERSLYGRRYMGLERATLLVGEDRRIIKMWRRVRVTTHVDEVTAFIAQPNG